LPEWAGLIQEYYRLRTLPASVNSASQFSRSTNYVPEAVVQYRDRLSDGPDDLLPNYALHNSTLNLAEMTRKGSASGGPSGEGTGLFKQLNPVVKNLDHLRSQRGMASIGEMMLMVNEPTDHAGAAPLITPPDIQAVFKQSWRMDLPGRG